MEQVETGYLVQHVKRCVIHVVVQEHRVLSTSSIDMEGVCVMVMVVVVHTDVRWACVLTA